jgi:hypothetical protein
LRGGDLRVGGEVELFEGDLFLEAGAADPAGQRGSLPAGDLVLTQDLQELQVAQGAVAGLGQAGVQGFQHPGQFQGA